MNRGKRVAILLCLFLPAAAGQRQSASGKTPSSGPAKLTALQVTGTARYTDKEILAASSLLLGQPAADGDFKEAVRRLGNSGMFSGIVYSYTSSGSSVKLELQLTDIDASKLVPAHFENLVWFTDADLLVELQRRVPLFRGKVPLTGDLADRIEEALQAILDEKQIPARIDYLREGPIEGGNVIGTSYMVEALEIRIGNVEFRGVGPDLLPGLEAAARKLQGAPYLRTSLAKIANVDFLPVCLKSGYLRASVADADARVLSQAKGEVEVDAIFPLAPGKVYVTSGVVWKGNSVVKSEELQGLLHLPLGQPADAVRLLHDLENVGKLYRSRGYMTVQVKPEAQFDEEHSAVHYDLSVVEGDLYKMGELEIAGLDTQATARMRAAWTLREDQPYNADYPNKFLDDTRQLVPRGVPWNVTVHESLDAKSKTVDVEIRFKQQ